MQSDIPSLRQLQRPATSSRKASGRPPRPRAAARRSELDLLGQYTKELSRYPLLGREQEAAIAQQALSGDPNERLEARASLVEHNLRFVVSEARRWWEKSDRAGVLMEMIADGNYGLWRAAGRFDPSKGVRFVTFASWWVDDAICQGLNGNRFAVRSARGQRQRLTRVREYQYRDAETRTGESIEAIARATGMTPTMVQGALASRVTMCSLDDPVHEEKSGLTLGDTLSEEVRDVSDARERRAVLDLVLREALQPNERRVLTAFHGVDMPCDITLELDQIGERNDVGRERERQIMVSAAHRLRQYLASRPHLCELLRPGSTARLHQLLAHERNSRID